MMVMFRITMVIKDEDGGGGDDDTTKRILITTTFVHSKEFQFDPKKYSDGWCRDCLHFII